MPQEALPFPPSAGIIWKKMSKIVEREQTNREFVELARKRHGFPRGEAVERSETDEERRNRPILHTVRKKGTI